MRCLAYLYEGAHLLHFICTLCDSLSVCIAVPMCAHLSIQLFDTLLCLDYKISERFSRYNNLMASDKNKLMFNSSANRTNCFHKLGYYGLSKD